MATASTSGRRRAVDVAVVVAFVVCAVVSVVVNVNAQSDDPAADVVVAAVAEQLAAQTALVQPGDRVLVHPPWRDDVVDALIAGGVFPRGVGVSEAFTRLSDGPWPALVVVDVGGGPLPASISARREAQGAATFRSGDVQLFRLGADVAGAGLDVRSADVSVEVKGKRIRCPYNSQRARHVCPGLPQWMTVGDETMQVGGRSERCIWAHPISGGRVVVDYGAVDVSAGLDFAAALSDAAADNARGAAVDLDLVVDDVVAAHARVHHQRGFDRHRVDGRAGVVARVKVVVSTDNDGQRHTCFRLSPRKP